MKRSRVGSTMLSYFRNEKGSTAYTYLGFAIILVVVIGALMYFPWGEAFKGKAADTSFVEANKAMADGNWKKALTLYEKALEANPKNAEAHLGRSRAYAQTGNLDNAMKEVNQALYIEPRNALAFGQRGVLRKLKNEYDEALKDFSQAIKIDPSYSWANAQKADILMRQDKKDEALASANKALKARPEFVEAIRLRARIQTTMGKCKEAFEDYKKIEQLSPKNPASLQDKAWFLLTCPDEKIQDPGKAMELAQKAYDLTNGQDGLIQETLAEAYFQQGDPLKAAEHQRKAIDLEAKKCPDGSCTQEMKTRLEKYQLAARKEKRGDYEILPLDCCSK